MYNIFKCIVNIKELVSKNILGTYNLWVEPIFFGCMTCFLEKKNPCVKSIDLVRTPILYNGNTCGFLTVGTWNKKYYIC